MIDEIEAGFLLPRLHVLHNSYIILLSLIRFNNSLAVIFELTIVKWP